MRTMRLRVVALASVMAAALPPVVSEAQQQRGEPYHATLYYGTGLVTIPTAWISTASTDIWMSTTAKDIPSIPNSGAMGRFARLNTNIAFDTHWGGRFSVGAAAHSQNPEYGFFGQVLVLRQREAGWMPSVAVGVRNVGPFGNQDRFFLGHDIRLNEQGEYESYTPERYQGFNTGATLYGVMTHESTVGRDKALGLTLGWGNGLFLDDGGLGDFYNRRGTLVPGLFAGARLTTHPTMHTTLTFMAENDGWDFNAGAVYDWRGISAGLYLTELEEGMSRSAQGGWVYNYTKVNFAIGYNGNVANIARGILLRTRIGALQREQQRLRFEIAERNRRIRTLEVALGRAQDADLAALDSRRKELEQQVQAERDAVRQAEERLRQLERTTTPSTQPPATQPPAGQPPATQPPAGTNQPTSPTP